MSPAAGSIPGGSGEPAERAAARPFLRRGLLAVAVLALAGCGGGSPSPAEPPGDDGNAPPPDDPVDVDNLYALAPTPMPVGVAVPAGDFDNSVLTSRQRRAIVDAHFSQVTAENIMKPSFLHPEESRYFFDHADALVDYAASRGKTVHGHVLIWHNQLPGWIAGFAPGDEAAWTAMMTDHADTIVARYAAGDVVASWDVVNEAFADRDDDGDGRYDLRDTVWLDNVGTDYIELAFEAAAAADPDADLYYNDYNLAGVPEKLNAVLAMVEAFRNAPDPVPIDGIGFQMHVSLDWPDAARIGEAFAAAAATGLKVKITELDVTVNTDGDGNPGGLTELTAAVAAAQEERYRTIVSAYLDSVPAPQRGGISVWGIADPDSWRRAANELEWPLLFDERFEPKPALRGFADGLTGT